MTTKLPPLDARIPAWKMDRLAERECPFCDSSSQKVSVIRPDGLAVHECGTCHAFFISPAPPGEELEAFYATYDLAHRRDATATSAELLTTYRSLGPLGDFRLRVISSKMRLQERRALDVGFGRGHFMWCLQALGAEVHGIELDGAAIRIARELGLLNVRKGMIGDCAEDRPYDLIILNDLIEHPLNPMDLLKSCSDLLTPGGMIALWTPNGGATAGEANPTTFRVDLEHMQYMTPATCAYVCHQLGLECAHLETCGFPNLKGIGQPRSSGGKTQSIKRFLKVIPGFAHMNRLRLNWRHEDERLGNYHLFCILRKPLSLAT